MKVSHRNRTPHKKDLNRDTSDLVEKMIEEKGEEIALTILRNQEEALDEKINKEYLRIEDDSHENSSSNIVA